MRSLVVLMILITGCTHNMGHINRFVREPIMSDQIKIPVKSKNSTKREVRDCMHVISIIPTKLHADIEGLFARVCKPGEHLVDADLKDTFWYVPLIYGKECIKLSAYCEEVQR